MSLMRISIYFLTLVLIGLADSSKRMIELSYPLKEGIPHYPTHKPFQINISYVEHKEDGVHYWYQRDDISGSTHTGTHLDAPCHFYKDRWCVTDIPLDHLITPVVVVDIRSKIGDNFNYGMTPGDLQEWEKKHGRIPDGSALLVLTGWGRYWNEPAKYLGSPEFDHLNLHFPGVSGEAAQWLADNRNIVGLGVDVVSIDIGNGHETGFPAHDILAKKNVWNLENLANLEQLPPTGAILYTMPMRIEGASGASARVVAMVGSSHHESSSTVSSAPLTLLTTIMMMML